MESLMLQSSAGAGCKSSSPLSPTDTAPGPAPALLSTPCWNSPATKCQLPLSAPGSRNPSSEKEEAAFLRPS